MEDLTGAATRPEGDNAARRRRRRRRGRRGQREGLEVSADGAASTADVATEPGDETPMPDDGDRASADDVPTPSTDEQ